MQGVHLFSIAAKQADFLAIRQQVVAGNIANADTPGYRARDVMPFSTVLANTQLALQTTSPVHLTASTQAQSGAELVAGKSWETTHSGNNVSPEQELIKASEVTRDFTLNARITKTFHRLYMSGVRT